MIIVIVITIQNIVIYLFSFFIELVGKLNWLEE